MVYVVGCGAAFIFYFIGHAPSLLEHNWPWSVIFLWPLLLIRNKAKAAFK